MMSRNATDEGSEEQIRDYDDVRHTDALVREYGTPPGGKLFAYREGNEHVVVSRGDEPRDRWTKRVPATVERPVPGQIRWTIPDNWELRVKSTRDDHAMGIYYVPESDVHAKVSIPTNNWLVDAWYRVKAVGDIDASHNGDLASATDVWDLADDYEADGHEEDAEFARAVAGVWSEVKTDLEMAAQWVADDGLDEMRSGDQPIRTDSGWDVEFQTRIFRPADVIKREVDVDEYEMPLSALLDDIKREAGLPNYYRFTLGIDTSDVDMDYYVRGLIEAGCSPTGALDYYMVEIEGLSQSEWADERGVDQSTISGTVSAAEDTIGK